MHCDKALEPLNYRSIDLEIHPETNALLKIGAVDAQCKQSLSYSGRFNPKISLNQLDEFCRGADFILGHNLSGHDIPWLKQHFPALKLLSLPLIDTLYLSPLAFPKNPYHRLVKDYKIVRESLSDPVSDAKLTVSLFKDQLNAFKKMPPEVTGAYGFLLNRSFPDDLYDTLFKNLIGGELPDLEKTRANLLAICEGKACRSRAIDVFNREKIDSVDAAQLAYIIAWLQVAGENSVLPPWVRHRFLRNPRCA